MNQWKDGIRNGLYRVLISAHIPQNMSGNHDGSLHYARHFTAHSVYILVSTVLHVY